MCTCVRLLVCSGKLTLCCVCVCVCVDVWTCGRVDVMLFVCGACAWGMCVGHVCVVGHAVGVPIRDHGPGKESAG